MSPPEGSCARRRCRLCVAHRDADGFGLVRRLGPPVVSAPVVPCAVRLYPLQPVYRVEQGPIHNVVIVPYEEPHLRFVYLPPRFVADCACYR